MDVTDRSQMRGSTDAIGTMIFALLKAASSMLAAIEKMYPPQTSHILLEKRGKPAAEQTFHA